jgi:hypothetical protein
MRETDIDQYCSGIAGLVKECPAEFTSSGIVAEEIAAFDNALDTYRQQADSKEVKTAESRVARKSLFECFDKADEILNSDIDTLVEVVKSSDENFYNQYKAARTIRDLGGHYSKNEKPAETPKTNPFSIAATA